MKKGQEVRAEFDVPGLIGVPDEGNPPKDPIFKSFEDYTRKNYDF